MKQLLYSADGVKHQGKSRPLCCYPVITYQVCFFHANSHMFFLFVCLSGVFLGGGFNNTLFFFVTVYIVLKWKKSWGGNETRHFQKGFLCLASAEFTWLNRLIWSALISKFHHLPKADSCVRKANTHFLDKHAGPPEYYNYWNWNTITRNSQHTVLVLIFMPREV